MTGALGGDVVACTGTASFDTATVGTGKTVTASGLTLTGAAAGNYVLSSTDRDDHRRDHGADGDAGRHGGEQGLRRDDGGDAHELHGDGRARRRCGGVRRHGGFDTASVGAGKTVTASGLTLTGAAAGNYVLSSTTATTTAAITARDGHAGDDGREQGLRRHDERRRSTSCTVTGAVGGDVVACTGTATFDTASVGTARR